MIIGIPREIKQDEYRVAIAPSGVKSLASDGHKVLIEKGAGVGSGIEDEEYQREGAEVVEKSEKIFALSDMVMKVKEPLPQEYPFLREGQILYTYLHLAAAPELAAMLLEKKIIGVAYETVQEEDGSLPLLVPMSEVAGRMAIHEGGKYLEREKGGRGILLGGVPGVEPGKVAILGGGVVGFNAAKMAVGAGADVTLIDINLNRLRYIDDIFKGRVKTLMSNHHNIEAAVRAADLVVGAVLIPGAKAPYLLTRGMLKTMKSGSVIVDVCIDQGGCVETSRPTSHSDPVYVVDGVIHYCVANMPGVVSRTSTFALTNATFPYARKIADLGIEKAVMNIKPLARGVNVARGHLTHRAVAESLGKGYCPLEKAFLT
ncbi:MAG: alanine dehydrogenase [Nitrospinae bacterium]|nr:alanine dehydrogenase [Nitrospinota bacterium]